MWCAKTSPQPGIVQKAITMQEFLATVRPPRRKSRAGSTCVQNAVDVRSETKFAGKGSSQSHTSREVEVGKEIKFPVPGMPEPADTRASTEHEQHPSFISMSRCNTNDFRAKEFVDDYLKELMFGQKPQVSKPLQFEDDNHSTPFEDDNHSTLAASDMFASPSISTPSKTEAPHAARGMASEHYSHFAHEPCLADHELNDITGGGEAEDLNECTLNSASLGSFFAPRQSRDSVTFTPRPPKQQVEYNSVFPAGHFKTLEDLVPPKSPCSPGTPRKSRRRSLGEWGMKLLSLNWH